MWCPGTNEKKKEYDQARTSYAQKYLQREQKRMPRRKVFSFERQARAGLLEQLIFSYASVKECEERKY